MCGRRGCRNCGGVGELVGWVGGGLRENTVRAILVTIFVASSVASLATSLAAAHLSQRGNELLHLSLCVKFFVMCRWMSRMMRVFSESLALCSSSAQTFPNSLRDISSASLFFPTLDSSYSCEHFTFSPMETRYASSETEKACNVG